MNILLVDDQKVVLDSLKKGIRWERLPVEQVYAACSAREARQILNGFAVDVLVSDIEMPEEDGLTLCNWAKERFPDLECIFLTSHADFEYAKTALRIGGFDYILQPARFEEIEQVILRACQKIREKRKILQAVDAQKRELMQRNMVLDAMMSRIAQEKYKDAGQTFLHFQEMFQPEYEDCMVYPILIQVLKWKRITNVWEEELVRLVLCNVLEELFEDFQGKTGITGLTENCHWVFLVLEKKGVTEEVIREKLNSFYSFIDGSMDFSIAVYPVDGLLGADIGTIYRRLSKRAEQNTERRKGIYWEDAGDAPGSEQEDPIEAAILYIKKNLNKNFTRTDVAEYVHLNEEYFSRLFRQQTGDTFKDYVLAEKMREAKKLLEHSRLSVSIIASKLGYDNFSHFSKMFKRVTDMTPQEYRKRFQN